MHTQTLQSPLNLSVPVTFRAPGSVPRHVPCLLAPLLSSALPWVPNGSSLVPSPCHSPCASPHSGCSSPFGSLHCTLNPPHPSPCPERLTREMPSPWGAAGIPHQNPPGAEERGCRVPASQRTPDPDIAIATAPTAPSISSSAHGTQLGTLEVQTTQRWIAIYLPPLREYCSLPPVSVTSCFALFFFSSLSSSKANLMSPIPIPWEAGWGCSHTGWCHIGVET